MNREEKNFETFISKKIVNLSDGYKEIIIYSNRLFNEFCLKKYKLTVDQVIAEAKKDEEPEDYMLEIFQDWVNIWVKKVGHSAMRNYMSGVTSFLKYEKIRIDLKDVELPKKIQEERYAISDNEIRKILEVAPYDKRAYYLALISTGARPVEIVGLRKKDFELVGEKWKAVIPAHLTKKGMTRTVFFSSEVTASITTLFNRCKTDDSMVFGTNTDPTTARENENSAFRYYCQKLVDNGDSIFDERYESTRYRKINLYCFRARFFTRVLNVTNTDTAHSLIGHGAYLQQYQRRTEEEKKDLWDEIESSILVFENKKKHAKLELEQKMKNSLLQSQIADLQKEMSTLKFKNQVEVNEVQTDSGYTKNLLNQLMQDKDFKKIIEKVAGKSKIKVKTKKLKKQ